MTDLALNDYPIKTFDKLRYADTDRQGHINNAVFATFLETGRVELLYHPEFPLVQSQASFVIASLQLSFLQEITWPGQVDIGTGVVKIGNSSVTLRQGIFQDGQLVAQAETVIVQVDGITKRGSPLSAGARARLQALLLPTCA